MKKLKYLAFPLMAAVLLASCGGNEERTESEAITTEAPLIIISMTEGEAPAVETTSDGATSAVTTAEATSPAAETSSRTDKTTAPKSVEPSESPAASQKTTDKSTTTTRAPIITEDDGVEVVEEESAEELPLFTQSVTEAVKPPETTYPSSETIRIDYPITAPATNGSENGTTPAVTTSPAGTTAPETTLTSETSADKPIELPFVPAL